MNKMDLIETLAKKLGLSKAKAKETIETIVDEITKALSRKEEVVLTGFGTFKVAYRQARTGRNPQTGTTLQIPAMNVPKFKPGKALKDAVK